MLGEACGHPVYYAWGYGGQIVYIVLDLGLTVVMKSDPDGPREGGHVQALHAILADRLVPAAEREGGAPARSMAGRIAGVAPAP